MLRKKKELSILRVLIAVLVMIVIGFLWIIRQIEKSKTEDIGTLHQEL